MYAAIKGDGRRFYQLARKGKWTRFEAESAAWSGIEYMGGEGDTRTISGSHAAKACNIRTLCHDIGQPLGCGAHM